ncbi:MAG: Smr/MutS family protein [Candidatus Tectimicrobiota bacterium]
MARKKLRTPPPAPPKPPAEEPFYRPFQDFKAQLKALKNPPPKPVPPSRPPPPPSRPARPTPSVSPQEKAWFLDAMTGVTPLQKDPRGRMDKQQVPVQRGSFPLDDLEALADLQDLVDGRGPFTIQYTDEYMEGVAPGVDMRLAARLHRGDYAVHDHLDLHGHTVEAAKIAMDRFMTSAYLSGQRCVLIIHGRGLNSRDNRPVLKEQVRYWLSHGRLSRMVLAFATAPINNGGAGAVYVLLRRAPQWQKK